MSLARIYARVYDRRSRKPPRGRAVWVIAVSLLLSLIFNAALVALVVLGESGKRERIERPSRPVTLRTISGQQWAMNRGDLPRHQRDSATSSNAPPPPPEEKKQQEQKPQGQVVDVAPGNNQEDPNAKYLAESSNKVKKETHAKNQTPFYRNAMPRQSSTVPNANASDGNAEKAQTSGNNGLAQDDRPLANPGKKAPAFEIPDVQRRDEIALKDTHEPGPGRQVSNRSESDSMKGNSDRLRLQKGEQGATNADQGSKGHQGAPGMANLLPSMSVLDKLNGGAPNDHLADTDEGEGTFLNTKEWKYASFFNRVKQSVGEHWDPGTPLRERDPSGKIYSGRDRYTVVNVTLTDHGVIKEIYVEKSCGIDFLDVEAIKSFERAQPFPNPPPGLMGSDQTVHFSFGFFMEMGSGGGLRIFRQGG